MPGQNEVVVLNPPNNLSSYIYIYICKEDNQFLMINQAWSVLSDCWKY